DLAGFVEMRRHVKRLQAGSPLLLRVAPGPGGSSGDAGLDICKFWVTKDLLSLKWQEQEGTGKVCEVPLSAITDVVEAAPEGQEADPDHYAISVALRPGTAPGAMDLMCASPEDFESWRDGLKFLIGSTGSQTSSPQARSPQGAAAAAAAGSRSSRCQELERELQKQLEVSMDLQRENQQLREAASQKDAAIVQLVTDLQAKSSSTDRCNKTESTSHESDNHLRDREVAILQRKNGRLRKELHAKQRTISDLLKLVGKVTAQQGAESSAAEGAEEDETEDAEDAEDVDDERQSSVPSPTAMSFRSAGQKGARTPTGRPAPPPSRGLGGAAAVQFAPMPRGRRRAATAAPPSHPPCSPPMRRRGRRPAALPRPSQRREAAAPRPWPPCRGSWSCWRRRSDWWSASPRGWRSPPKRTRSDAVLSPLRRAAGEAPASCLKSAQRGPGGPLGTERDTCLLATIGAN
ncbi:unnamed protein product, partial [Prorocentrum cordatum]